MCGYLLVTVRLDSRAGKLSAASGALHEVESSEWGVRSLLQLGRLAEISEFEMPAISKGGLRSCRQPLIGNRLLSEQLRRSNSARIQ